MTKKPSEPGHFIFPGFSEAVQRASQLDKPHHIGHRDRLKQRFRTAPDTLADYELLELFLFRVIPRSDTKPIAKSLLNRFGTLAEVLGASERLIAEVPGAGPMVATEIKVLEAILKSSARSQVMHREVLGSWSKVIDYCTAAMAYETREQFRILFLDKKNRLIADEVQQQGTVDHTPVYPREVMRRALELSATAIILVHNHPSGDPTPSRADIEMTKVLVEAAKALGITVHDHVIVGKEGCTSFRGLKLI